MEVAGQFDYPGPSFFPIFESDMADENQDNISRHIDEIYRSESPRVLATLVRMLGDLDRAEEAMHEAFAAAVKQWPGVGVPLNPRAWLISAGRFKGVDGIRDRAKDAATVARLARELPGSVNSAEQNEVLGGDADDQKVDDDVLRLIFLCCNPANPTDAQIALTLREVCGLTTEQIAEAYLIEVPALAKRIVRAKVRLRAERIPFEVPWAELPTRLEIVLKVIYLMFNEGYSASSGDTLVRPDLSAEAIRLGRLLVELLPEPEAVALLALMLLQESRREARVTTGGDLILLDEQDRALWNQEFIKEGVALVERALTSGGRGPYSLQAAIAALHAEAREPADTDWPQILALYDLLFTVDRSPVVALNRAVAVAMCRGPAAGIAIVEQILAEGHLPDYHLAHSIRADLYRRAGNVDEARRSYRTALYLARQAPERRFLHRQLEKLTNI